MPDSQTCLCTLVRKVDRSINRIYDDALAPSGLLTTQFALLRNLDRLNGVAPVGTLAAQMAMDRTTLSRNLQPLVRDGLLEISPTADKRVRQIRMTSVGRRHLEAALPFWESVQWTVSESIGTAQAAELKTQLAGLLASLDRLSVGTTR